MSEKLCVFCVHMDTDEEKDGSESMGEWTNHFIGCGKGHWRVEVDYSFPRNYRETILKAQGCPDYKPAIDPPNEQEDVMETVIEKDRYVGYLIKTTYNGRQWSSLSIKTSEDLKKVRDEIDRFLKANK